MCGFRLAGSRWPQKASVSPRFLLFYIARNRIEYISLDIERGQYSIDAVLIMNMIDGRRPGAEYVVTREKGFQLDWTRRGLQIQSCRYAGFALVYSGYCMYYVRMLDNCVVLNMNMYAYMRCGYFNLARRWAVRGRLPLRCVRWLSGRSL